MKALKKLNKIYICGAVFGIFASLCIVTLSMYLSYAMSEPQIAPSGEIVKDPSSVPHIHPNFYSIATVVGVVALIICFLSAIINSILLKKTERKIKTILIEFAFMIAAYMVFIFVWGVAWQIICDMLTGIWV